MGAGLLLLAVACDNQITEIPPPRAPSATPAAAKAPFKSLFMLNPILGSGSTFAISSSISDLGQAVGNGGNYAAIWDNSDIAVSLGTLPGGTYSYASAISRDGSVIVGQSSDGPGVRPVRWLKVNGQWTIDQLTDVFPGGCSPSDVSSDGTAIVGNCGTTPIVWLNGRVIFLGSGLVYGVNKNGQAVGQSTDGNQALVWQFTTVPVTVTDIGNLGGGIAVATAINNAGQITGWSYNAAHESHAYLWSPRKGVMVDLGTPGTTSGGYDVNEAGQVVGDIWLNTEHAALFDAGKVVDLTILPGYDGSVAVSINNNGQAVGYSFTYSFNPVRPTEWLLK